MYTESDIAFEGLRHWVARTSDGHFIVYRVEATASTRVAYIGYSGAEGLARARAECERRDRALEKGRSCKMCKADIVTNKEGLTLNEWLRAADYPFERYCTIPVAHPLLTVAKRLWAEGTDPTDCKAAGSFRAVHDTLNG